MDRQPTLRPQDVVVCLKLAISPYRRFTLSELAKEVVLSVGEIHLSLRRLRTSALVAATDGAHTALKSNTLEFVLHGVRYAFPAKIGPMSQGVPTGLAATSSRSAIVESDEALLVWPDIHGEHRGQAITPLYPGVSAAARLDPALHAALGAVDAIRAGRAREREIASELLLRVLA
jgi:hypothetical protein